MGLEVRQPISPMSKEAGKSVIEAGKALVPKDGKDLMLGFGGRLYTNKDGVGDKLITAGKQTTQVAKDVVKEEPSCLLAGMTGVIGATIADLIKGAFAD